MRIGISSSGSTKRLESFLASMEKLDFQQRLAAQAQAGVAALAAATPKESGLAATSWTYEIKNTGRSVSIIWKNTNIEGGFPVAIMLQHGYATGTGGYVAGRDYINPAIRPIMDRISNDVWKEVTSA